jgi:hypothetical protein
MFRDQKQCFYSGLPRFGVVFGNRTGIQAVATDSFPFRSNRDLAVGG